MTRKLERRDHPPAAGGEIGSYGVLEMQVDADGNDVAEIRSVFLQAPIGTYTGWKIPPQGPLRERHVRSTRQLHSLRRDEGGALGHRGPPAFNRRALSIEGDLSCGLQKGGYPPPTSSRTASAARDAALLVGRAKAKGSGARLNRDSRNNRPAPAPVDLTNAWSGVRILYLFSKRFAVIWMRNARSWLGGIRSGRLLISLVREISLLLYFGHRTSKFLCKQLK